MLTKNAIEKEILQLDILKVITRAYAQIASVRIRKMRSGVLLSRSYLESIHTVFQDILDSYKSEAEKLANKKGHKGGTITFLSHNGRTVAVFISANSRLYGDLILRTFHYFVEQIKDKDVEVTIVGKYGLALFEEAYPDRPFTYFDFPDAKMDSRSLHNLISHLVQYEEIDFYYPEFQNSVNQQPQLLKISSGSSFSKSEIKSKTKYLFEPSLEAVLVFFETQVFSSLMEQTLQEAHLAKFASRVLSMDRANERIREEIKNMRMERLKLTHQLANKKQMQVLTGLSLWQA